MTDENALGADAAAGQPIPESAESVPASDYHKKAAAQFRAHFKPVPEHPVNDINPDYGLTEFCPTCGTALGEGE